MVRCRWRGRCGRLGCFLLGSCGLAQVVFPSTSLSGVVWFIVGDFVDVCGIRSCGTFLGLSVRLYDHPQSPSLGCLECLLRFLCHRPCSWSTEERWCHRGSEAFHAVFELDLDCVFEGDELAEVFDLYFSGGRISMFIP